jgi:hypothetical protein
MEFRPQARFRDLSGRYAPAHEQREIERRQTIIEKSNPRPMGIDAAGRLSDLD